MQLNEIDIPKKDGTFEKLTFNKGESIIIVGANGSGKTRLAVFIEESLGEKCHRISAHRALNLNPSVAKIPEQQAISHLKLGHDYGNIDQSNFNYLRNMSRWNKKQSVSLLNDFDSLLQYLFAQQSNVFSKNHRITKNNAASSFDTKVLEKTKFDILQETWEKLLTDKKLDITGDDIQVISISAGQKYSASEMSDGERAIFYMLGQVLYVEDESVIIFDEPELHIHKSIMSNLWDELEALKPNCSFLTITHDIEFASSRVADKYVIKSYEATPKWEINPVPDSYFDEETITKILGSRKPILFVEGTLTSLDSNLYRACYPEWTIISRGSCKDVIHSVISSNKLNENTPTLNIKCAGIVDRDNRNQADIDYLKGLKIEILQVAEIENIFCLQEVAKVILEMEQYNDNDINEKMDQYINGMIEYIQSQETILKAVAVRNTHRTIDNLLKQIDLANSTTPEKLQEELDLTIQEIQNFKIEDYITSVRTKINEGIVNKDLDSLLETYENKGGLLNKCASLLKNTKKDSFENYLKRAMQNKNSKLLTVIKSKLPILEL
nr:AAA family ATPase [Moraxella osloensis]